MLCLAVLIVAVLNLARLGQSLVDWQFLETLLPISPAYLAVTGLAAGMGAGGIKGVDSGLSYFEAKREERRQEAAANELQGILAQAQVAAAAQGLPPESVEGEVPPPMVLTPMTNEEKVLITQSVKEVGEIMSNYVGIVRSDLRLKRAWDRLDMLYEETENLFKRVKASRDICELRNMINVGYLITRWAIERKECRGLHYTIDYPVHAYDK